MNRLDAEVALQNRFFDGNSVPWGEQLENDGAVTRKTSGYPLDYSWASLVPQEG